MKAYLTQDSLITLRDILQEVTFNTYNGTDFQGTATTISVSVRTSPFPDNDTTAGIYILPITANRPPRAVGDFVRKVEEHFWLYCQAPKKSTLSDIIESLMLYVDSRRKSSSRTGAQAEIAFIDIVGERNASLANQTPQKHVKIVEVRMYWWSSLGA